MNTPPKNEGPPPEDVFDTFPYYKFIAGFKRGGDPRTLSAKNADIFLGVQLKIEVKSCLILMSYLKGKLQRDH